MVDRRREAARARHPLLRCRPPAGRNRAARRGRLGERAGEDARRELDPDNPRPTIARIGRDEVRHYLNALSGLYTRAVSEGIVDQNPVAAMIDKPRGAEEEAAFLSVPDAALLLEAARTYRPTRDQYVFKRDV